MFGSTDIAVTWATLSLQPCFMGSRSSKNFTSASERPNVTISPSRDIKNSNLIYGYCRRLTYHQQIPTDIINICLKFHGDHYSKQIYFASPGLNQDFFQIGVFDMNSFGISHLKCRINNINIVYDDGICYVPDISDNGELHGIFFVTKNDSNLGLLFFSILTIMNILKLLYTVI